MPTPRRKRIPKPDRVRALELPAGCGAEGCTEAGWWLTASPRRSLSRRREGRIG